jgi:hypothetical protein
MLKAVPQYGVRTNRVMSRVLDPAVDSIFPKPGELFTFRASPDLICRPVPIPAR